MSVFFSNNVKIWHKNGQHSIAQVPHHEWESSSCAAGLGSWARGKVARAKISKILKTTVVVGLENRCVYINIIYSIYDIHHTVYWRYQLHHIISWCLHKQTSRLQTLLHSTPISQGALTDLPHACLKAWWSCYQRPAKQSWSWGSTRSISKQMYCASLLAPPMRDQSGLSTTWDCQTWRCGMWTTLQKGTTTEHCP